MRSNRRDSRPSRRRLMLGAILLFTIMLASVMPTATALDTEKPYVVSNTPTNGENDVDINMIVQIEFSEEIRSSNLDSYITLKDSRGFLVLKQVDYSNLTNKARLTPLEPFKYSTMYIVSISTFIQDLSGNPLKRPVQWTFNTTREKEPPSVVSTTPKNNALSVQINATISVMFSEEMDFESLRTGIVVHDSLGNPVIGNTTPDDDGMTMGFDPLFSFGYGEFYTITVLKTVKDLAGNTMVNEYEFGFRVQLEQIPPRVVNLEPVDESQFVSRNSKVSVTFSEPMNSTSLAGAVVIEDSDLESIPATPFYNADNYTLVIKPDQGLDYQTLYTVTIQTIAMDIAGNTLDKEYYTTFTTEPLPQQAPNIVGRLPPEDRFSWYEGIAAKFEIDATDPNDDILVYTWFVNGEEREGETFNEFNFYPEPGSEGSYKIEVEIFDGVTAPVKHYWIIDVVRSSPEENGNDDDDVPFQWSYFFIILIVVVVTGVMSFGYLRLMDRKSEILARTRRRLRPMSLKKQTGPERPPSYEEMYLRQDSVYGQKSPEFKPVAPPGGPMVTGIPTAGATVTTAPVMGDAPQLIEAKEIKMEKATVGPYTTAAPELKRTKTPGAFVCPKCGRKAIEAAHGRMWCDTCGFVG